jgi:hypothetical protein
MFGIFSEHAPIVLNFCPFEEGRRTLFAVESLVDSNQILTLIKFFFDDFLTIEHYIKSVNFQIMSLRGRGATEAVPWQHGNCSGAHLPSAPHERASRCARAVPGQNAPHKDTIK